MANARTNPWLVLVVLVLVSCFGACGAYIRMGTDPIAGYVCPDGKWEALVMVRNGGAMDRFSTQISVVSTTNPVVEQLARSLNGALVHAADWAPTIAALLEMPLPSATGRTLVG